MPPQKGSEQKAPSGFNNCFLGNDAQEGGGGKKGEKTLVRGRLHPGSASRREGKGLPIGLVEKEKGGRFDLQRGGGNPKQ